MCLKLQRKRFGCRPPCAMSRSFRYSPLAVQEAGFDFSTALQVDHVSRAQCIPRVRRLQLPWTCVTCVHRTLIRITCSPLEAVSQCRPIIYFALKAGNAGSMWESTKVPLQLSLWPLILPCARLSHDQHLKKASQVGHHESHILYIHILGGELTPSAATKLHRSKRNLVQHLTDTAAGFLFIARMLR